MLGTICKRDIPGHPVVTFRSFGWRVFVRAVFAGRKTTELNQVFRRVVTTHHSPFVRRLARFQTATRRHTRYIRDRIVQALPDLRARCEEVSGSLNL